MPLRATLLFLGVFVILSSPVCGEGAAQPSISLPSASVADSGVSSIPVSELPNRPRGFALICSVVALGAAAQQMWFKRKPSQRFAQIRIDDK
jgi:hypothetical protein